MKITGKILLFSVLTLIAGTDTFAQSLPQIQVNHIRLVVSPDELIALRDNPFLNAELAITKSTMVPANNSTYPGFYLFGTNIYLEIFDTTSLFKEKGSAGVIFSVDSVGQLEEVKSALEKKYTCTTESRNRMFDGKSTPWFKALYLDEKEMQSSKIIFWILEYDTAYFDKKQLPHPPLVVSREAYQKQFITGKDPRILTAFTSLTLNVSATEMQSLGKMLLDFGYRQSDNIFTAPDGFLIRMKQKSENSPSSVGSLEFTGEFYGKMEINPSPHTTILLDNNKGVMIFH